MSRKLSSITNKLDSALENTADMALKRRARRIIELLEPNSSDKILDVGCGDGYYLHLLSKLGKKYNLTGCDFDEAALASAKSNLAKTIKLIPADLMKRIPFKNSSFNKVVMSEVCEHLPNDVKGLKEVFRVMKKGGTLVVSVPNHRYPILWDPVNWLLERIFNTHIKSGFFAGIWNQHVRLYTEDEIKRSVEKAGFEIETSEALTFWSLPFNHYIVNLGARILASQKKENKSEKSNFNKFSKNRDKSGAASLVFTLFNTIDKLNDLMPGFQKKASVSIVVKAVKK